MAAPSKRTKSSASSSTKSGQKASNAPKLKASLKKAGGGGKGGRKHRDAALRGGLDGQEMDVRVAMAVSQTPKAAPKPKPQELSKAGEGLAQALDGIL